MSPDSGCMRCCRISDEHHDTHNNRLEKCVMRIGAYLASNHQCKVCGYNKKKASYESML